MKKLENIKYLEPQDKDTLSEDLVIHSVKKDNNKLILFIHGLRGKRYGASSTWGKFPQLLSEDLSDFDIGLYQYNTVEKRAFRISLSIENEARHLANLIRDNLRNYKKIIIIAHSMGGILAKSIIYQLIVNNDISVIKKISGLFLMATPNFGAKWIPYLISNISKDFKVLKNHNEYLTKVNKTIDNYFVFNENTNIDNKRNLPVWTVVASNDIWVEEQSASICLSSERIKFIKGSHTTIVKPENKDDDVYCWIKEKILLCDKPYQHDIFISFPMSTWKTEEEYKEHQKKVQDFSNTVKVNLNLNTIYCDVLKIEEKKLFETQTTSMNTMINNIKNSKYYILIVPNKSRSSIYFEAGFALALNKPTAYFVKGTNKNLPYVMQGVNNNINIIEYDNYDNLIEKIRIEKTKIFNEGVI